MPSATALPRRATVLLVEDEATLRDGLATSLRAAGFRVLCAERGEAALRLLAQQRDRIDWLFTELALPGLVDGWIVADEYRSQRPTRPAIVGCPAGRPVPAVAGAIRVTTPIAPREIVALLMRLIGRCRRVPRRRPLPA